MANTCTGKIQIPITGSTTDGVAYIAANYPNGNIADYTFFITPSEYNSVMSPTNSSPFNIGGSFGQTAPCAVYDTTGAVMAYQVYVQEYKFIHILAPPGQYGGQGANNGPYSIPPQSTYSDFVDAINMTIHLPLLGAMLANINIDYYTVCDKANATIIGSTQYNNSTSTIGCQITSQICNCPNTVINPCATTALNTGIQPTNVIAATYSLQGAYVTGTYLEWPIGSGDYWFLYAIGYTVSTPFVWALTNTNPSTHDAWVPCGVDPGPTENPNDCPNEFLSYQDLSPTPYQTYPSGPWDPNIGYQVGETFTMDWYNDGLGILLSHSDPNWINFISGQGLSNPITQFELPDYDWVDQEWINQGSGIIVEFLGNCNNVPGVHEYISLVHNIPPFNDSTPNDWTDGFSIPGFASAGGIGIPYWQSPGADDYPGVYPTDVVWYAQQGLSLVNGEVACCKELLIGCMDPIAVNYNPTADLACPDLPQMGTDQWGNPVSLGPPDGLPDCCEYNDVGEVAECLPKLTKEEFLMNIAQKPETRSDVFIERGKTSVFERTQRLAQTPTIGELTIHGYGYYKINEQRF